MVRRKISSIDPNDFGKDLGLIHEVVIKLRKYGAGRNFLKELFKEGEFLLQVIELAKKLSCLDFIAGKFMSPALQLMLVKEANCCFGWGFTDKDFKAIENLPVVFDADGARPAILDISLDTPQETFEAAIICLEQVYKEVIVSPRLKLHSQPLSSDSSEFSRGLRWVFLETTFGDSNQWSSFLKQKGLTLANSAGLWSLFYFVDAYKNCPSQALTPIRGYQFLETLGTQGVTDNLELVVGYDKLTIRTGAMVNACSSYMLTQLLLD